MGPRIHPNCPILHGSDNTPDPITAVIICAELLHTVPARNLKLVLDQNWSTVRVVICGNVPTRVDEEYYKHINTEFQPVRLGFPSSSKSIFDPCSISMVPGMAWGGPVGCSKSPRVTVDGSIRESLLRLILIDLYGVLNSARYDCDQIFAFIYTSLLRLVETRSAVCDLFFCSSNRGLFPELLLYVTLVTLVKTQLTES
jgi:hypothetical protein